MALKFRNLSEVPGGSGESIGGPSPDAIGGNAGGNTELEGGASGIEGNGDSGAGTAGAFPDAGAAEPGPAPVVKRRIGRPPGSKTGQGKGKSQEAEAASGPARSGGSARETVDLKPKPAPVRNDRKFVADNAQALHQLAAMFLGGPHWIISPAEATELANKSCDVLDHMGWSITGGEVGLIGKVVALGLCVYMIEGPRIAQTVAIRKSGVTRPTQPASPMEASAPPKKGQIDLSGLM